jgi:hypothetical protein
MLSISITNKLASLDVWSPSVLLPDKL